MVSKRGPGFQGMKSWIECNFCGIEQPESGNFDNRKQAEIGAKRHGWKVRLKRPEGYIDLCPDCYENEAEKRLFYVACGYDMWGLDQHKDDCDDEPEELVDTEEGQES